MLLKALSNHILLWRVWYLQLRAQLMLPSWCEKEDVDSLTTMSPPSNCISPSNSVCRRPWPARENSCPQHSGGHCNFPPVSSMQGSELVVVSQLRGTQAAAGPKEEAEVWLVVTSRSKKNPPSLPLPIILLSQCPSRRKE